MSLVGTMAKPFRFVVEAVKVKEFAKAVRDPTAGADEPAVPPTFPMWGVSGFEGQFLFEVLKLDRTRCLNAGQEYEYVRQLKAGDRLLCTPKVVDDYEKTSARSGRMRFVVFEIEMRDEDTGELVVTSRATTVEIAPRPAA